MHVSKVIGFQSFTSSDLAAVRSVSSQLLVDAQTGQKANAAWLSVGATTGAIRFRDDGGVPNASTGLRLVPGITPFLYQGDIQKLKFISEFGIATLEASYVQVSD